MRAFKTAILSLPLIQRLGEDTKALLRLEDDGCPNFGLDKQTRKALPFVIKNRTIGQPSNYSISS